MKRLDRPSKSDVRMMFHFASSIHIPRVKSIQSPSGISVNGLFSWKTNDVIWFPDDETPTRTSNSANYSDLSVFERVKSIQTWEGNLISRCDANRNNWLNLELIGFSASENSMGAIRLSRMSPFCWNAHQQWVFLYTIDAHCIWIEDAKWSIILTSDLGAYLDVS